MIIKGGRGGGADASEKINTTNHILFVFFECIKLYPKYYLGWLLGLLVGCECC